MKGVVFLLREIVILAVIVSSVLEKGTQRKTLCACMLAPAETRDPAFFENHTITGKPSGGLAGNGPQDDGSDFSTISLTSSERFG
jgi:hypothetical protein